MNNVKIIANGFVLRQTKESPFSYYAGQLPEVVRLVETHWEEQTPGYRDGVITVRVPSEGFYSGVAQLKEDDELSGSFKSRRKGELPRKQIGAKGAQKVHAQQTDIVLYRKDVLAESNDNTPDVHADWEIISINASPVVGEMPIHPETLCANYFGDDGGTDTNMSPEEFTTALRASREWWSNKAMCA